MEGGVDPNLQQEHILDVVCVNFVSFRGDNMDLNMFSHFIPQLCKGEGKQEGV